MLHASDNKSYLELNQNFKPPKENKIKFGEVTTPYYIIEEMLELFPEYCFEDKTAKWLDPACGTGYFVDVLIEKLMKSLQLLFPDPKKREKHIIEKMIYICEWNQENIIYLRNKFSKGLYNTKLKPQIFHQDFLSTTWNTFFKPSELKKTICGFDYIIGNPPYNSGGLKKVPTNTVQKKTSDGRTIWDKFIRHSVSLLKDEGYLSMIVPSIWMKPDKARMYDFMTQWRLHNIKTFTNTETNKIFKGQAQTPTCYFLLEKTYNNDDNNNDNTNTNTDIDTTISISNGEINNSGNIIGLYDIIHDKYVSYRLLERLPIPLIGCTIINKISDTILSKFPSIQTYTIKKTNTPSKKITISKNKSLECKYPNIRSCILRDKTIPELSIEYSNEPCDFYGVEKIVMAHKMYGFPFYDKEGKYGVSARDNYVITDLSGNEWHDACDFFNTKLARFLFESTRYRMKYLEKYVFEFIPHINQILSLMPDMKEETDHIINHKIQINDNVLYKIFNLNKKELEYIKNFNTINYKSFNI